MKRKSFLFILSLVSSVSFRIHFRVKSPKRIGRNVNALSFRLDVDLANVESFPRWLTREIANIGARVVEVEEYFWRSRVAGEHRDETPGKG